jgi:drug/metabolite transporter (DMT)-like permease
MKNSSNDETTTRGYLIALLGVAIWSTTAIFIRYLNDAFDMPAMAIAFWRDFFVAIALVFFFLLINRNRFRFGHIHLRFIVGYGLTLAIFNSLWTVSVKMNGAAIATVLIYSSAAFTALYERWFLGGRLGWRKALAILLSLFGCVLVSGVYNPAAWKLNPWGILVGLLSGIGFTAYSLLGKKSASKGINSWTALMYSFVVASLFLLIFNLFPDPSSHNAPLTRLFWLGDSFWGWLVLVVLAIGPSIGGYGLYTYSLGYLSASVANLIATLEPSMTAFLAYILLGERFTPAQILGSILILAGVIILRLRERLSRTRKITQA